MQRGATLALVLAAGTFGCGGRSSGATAADAAPMRMDSDGGTNAANGASVFCGCDCYAADACPQHCYVEQSFEPDGATMPLFCGDRIATCYQQDAAAWSFGEPMDNCGSGGVTDFPGTPMYIDGGPDGAFCCEYPSGGP